MSGSGWHPGDGGLSGLCRAPVAASARPWRGSRGSARTGAPPSRRPPRSTAHAASAGAGSLGIAVTIAVAVAQIRPHAGSPKTGQSRTPHASRLLGPGPSRNLSARDAPHGRRRHRCGRGSAARLGRRGGRAFRLDTRALGPHARTPSPERTLTSERHRPSYGSPIQAARAAIRPWSRSPPPVRGFRPLL